jgi:uncharacterized membrane protein
MGLVLPVHIIAAGLGLVFGCVALCAAKGRTLHRKSGMLFVCAMLAMELTGAGMAAFKWNVGNVVAGLLTAYLVITALITVRLSTAGLRRLEVGAMLIALALGVACGTLGFEALASPRGTRFGIPFGVFFMFGTVALLAGIGDVRMMRSGGFRGVPRLTRHLWRMCYALWIAAASFFLGSRARVAKVLPEPLLNPALLALPVLAVVVVMFYWLWRVRLGRTFRGNVGVTAPEAVLNDIG